MNRRHVTVEEVPDEGDLNRVPPYIESNDPLLTHIDDVPDAERRSQLSPSHEHDGEASSPLMSNTLPFTERRDKINSGKLSIIPFSMSGSTFLIFSLHRTLSSRL